MASKGSVVLITNDGERFEVSLAVVRELRTLHTMLERE